MKRALILLMLALLIIPFVRAAENDISLSKAHIQMGDSFTINANNIKINDAIFNGNAMINFNGPETYTLLVNVVNGAFTYSASFCKSGCLLTNMPGNYSIGVSLLDSRLVELQEILVPENLEVDGTLNIIAELDKVQISPGESIKIEGSVQKNSDSSLVNDGTIKLIFDGVEYESVLSNKKVVYEFNTCTDVVSNYHDIDLTITDDLGNYGEATVQYFVVAVPELLTINLDREDYAPGENVQITVGLNDQADEAVTEEVEVKIYDAKNKRVFKELVLSNEEFGYELEDYAVPGEWRIVVKGVGLKVEKTFNVQSNEKILISLIGQTLEVTNVGNVYYSKPLMIGIDGNVTHIEKRTNLDPSENLTLVLYKDIEEGMHKVYIENTEQTFDIEIVDNRGFGDKVGDFFSSVTGQAVRKSGTGTSNVPFLVLLILIVGMLVFITFTFRHKGKGLKLGGIFKFNKKATTKTDDVDDIRERILNDLKSVKTESKGNNSFPVKPIISNEEGQPKPNRVRFDEPIRKEYSNSNDNNKKINGPGASNLFKLFD